LRERSPGYLFAAGLVATVTAAGGYALGVITGGGTLGGAEWVRVLQLAAASAGVWALTWLGLHRLRHSRLLAVQLGLASVFVGLLLLPALALLTLDPLSGGAVGSGYPPPLPWTTETGALWSWVALALVG